VEQRLADFERRLTALEAKKHEIVLDSPSGHHSVTIRADDRGAGIWIGNSRTEGPWKPCVALYNGYGQGAVIGVWASQVPGQPHHDNGITACLATDQASGIGLLQLVDAKGLVTQYTTQNLIRTEPPKA